MQFPLIVNQYFDSCGDESLFPFYVLLYMTWISIRSVDNKLQYFDTPKNDITYDYIIILRHDWKEIKKSFNIYQIM